MTQNASSRLAYQDCFDLFDKALSNPRGIRIRCDEHANAWYMRLRLHSARQVDRNDNAKTYPPTDPKHGRSIYDGLVVRIKTDGEDGDGNQQVWLYIEKFIMDDLHIEELGEPVELAHVRRI